MYESEQLPLPLRRAAVMPILVDDDSVKLLCKVTELFEYEGGLNDRYATQIHNALAEAGVMPFVKESVEQYKNTTWHETRQILCGLIPVLVIIVGIITSLVCAHHYDKTKEVLFSLYVGFTLIVVPVIMIIIFGCSGVFEDKTWRNGAELKEYRQVIPESVMKVIAKLITTIDCSSVSAKMKFVIEEGPESSTRRKCLLILKDPVGYKYYLDQWEYDPPLTVKTLEVIMEANFRDGKLFTLGMTVIMESGREVKTSEDFVLKELKMPYGSIAILSRTGAMGISVNLLFSSQEARINHQVAKLEDLKKEIDLEIEFIKAGGDPGECHFL